MKSQFLFALLLSVLGMVACGKRTAESETARWNSAKARISTVKAQYPNFAAVADQVLQQAETAFKSAEGIGDEKQKVEAMSAAVNQASPSFITDLEGLEGLIRELDSNISKAKQTGGDQADRAAINDAAQRGDVIVMETRQMLKNAQPTDVASANAIAKTAKDNVESAKRTLSDLVSKAEKKISDSKKAEDDKKAADDKKAEDDKKAVADIKCSHCGNMNKAGTLQCGGCGAPLEKK